MRNEIPTVGEILVEEFLKPLNISQSELARSIGTSVPTISEIVRGRRKVSVEISFRLGKFFKLSPEFFYDLQHTYDIDSAKLHEKEIVKRVTKTIADFPLALAS